MIKLDFLSKKSSFSCADIVGILKNTKTGLHTRFDYDTISLL